MIHFPIFLFTVCDTMHLSLQSPVRLVLVCRTLDASCVVSQRPVNTTPSNTISDILFIGIHTISHVHFGSILFSNFSLQCVSFEFNDSFVYSKRINCVPHLSIIIVIDNIIYYYYWNCWGCAA